MIRLNIHTFLLLLRFHTENDKDKRSASEISQAKSRLGSFYLRVGAVAFGIGSMVYSGLEIGQYFELKGILNGE